MEFDSDTTVYVVFPVHNRIDSTRHFMKSLFQQTVSNYIMVICDDGSTDGTGEFLESNYPDVKVIKGSGNLWWTAGINRCVEYVLSCCKDMDYILTLNNDALLPEDYIEQKLARASEYPNAIIGSCCVFSDNETLIETSGYVLDFDKCLVKQLTRPGEVVGEKHKGVEEVTYLPGKGVLFPVNTFRDVGLYDEAHLPQYHADTDLVLRAYEAGYKVLVDFDSIVYSEVNTNNMVLPEQEMTLRAMASTFVGRYSMNNFGIYNYYAKKHFPGRKFRFLFNIYYRTIGGLAKRYLKYKLGMQASSS